MTVQDEVTSEAAAGRKAVKSVHRFGDFELSSPPSRLTRDGESVHLRPQVMRALTELVEHPGEIVTREHLRQTIWRDVEHVEVERGIKTVIRELRRALGDDPKNPRYIETIRGVGYRFVAPEQVVKESLVRLARRPKRPKVRIWVAAVGVIVALGLLVGLNILLSSDRPTLLTPVLRSAVESPQLTSVSERLSDELASELLTRYPNDIDLVHVLAPPGEISMSPRVASFAVDGHLSAVGSEGDLYISLELIDRHDGTIAWMGTYDVQAEDVDEWAGRAGRELVEAVLAQP